MKNILISLIIITAFLFMPASATNAAAVQVVLDSQNINDRFDVQPIISGTRVLVPLRAIFEAMGAVVNWDAANQTATAVKGGTTVVMVLGSLEPTVNGEVWPLEVPAQAIDGRILAPLRFAGEAFGGTATWDGPNYTAIIDSSGTPAPTEFRAASVTAAFSPVDCAIDITTNANTSKYGDVPLDVAGDGSIDNGGTAQTHIAITSNSLIFGLVMGDQNKTVDGCPFSELIYGPSSEAEQAIANLDLSENGNTYFLTGNLDDFPPSVHALLNNTISGVTFQSLTGDYIIYIDKASMQVTNINVSRIIGEGTSAKFGNVYLTGSGSLDYSY